MSEEYQPRLFATEKTCSNCGSTKPLNNFYRNKKSPDGHLAQCKACRKSKDKTYYEQNHAATLTQKKAYRGKPGNAERQARYQRGYRKLNAEAIAAQRKDYRERNRERNRSRKHEDYKANREKRLATGKKWRAANIEYARSKDKEYYEQNSESKRAWQRFYYHEHRDESLARNKQWCADNPEKVRATSKRNGAIRRARQANAAVGVVDFDAIWERDNGTCHICGKSVEKGVHNFDHVIPISRGGAHSSENISVAHEFCNKSKGVKMMHEYEREVSHD